MASIIPSLNKQTLSRMTTGEKRVARLLEKLLEDDYLIWYDIPVGKNRRYPDFIILNPRRGLLFLEVKDWKAETIKNIDKSSVVLLTENGEVTVEHPLEQVRNITYQVIHLLNRDPALQQIHEKYKGKPIMPYGWGVVFTKIKRSKIEQAIPEADREKVLPDHLMLYQEDLQEQQDAEIFQERLWDMFNYSFPHTLTLPEINRIRYHLFPEVRIDIAQQFDLFDDDELFDEDATIPDIIRIMDLQQEQLARSLGEGHRVIHGVAGSGKTMILGYRCVHLTQCTNRPILVLCYNITLAAKLRAFISSKGVDGRVEVYHFHDWCSQQLKTYQVDVPDGTDEYWVRMVQAVIAGVESGHIPREQYGALLIDEGHDFEEAWLKLTTQMIHPEDNHLLLLYDDAQSIYKSKAGLRFSLSSVGIQAIGRTTILRLNYRNTREILAFAYDFARHYLDPQENDPEHIPLVKPEAAGTSGKQPVFKQFRTFEQEISFAIQCLKKWHEQDDVPWKDIAILHYTNKQGEQIRKQLTEHNIPHSHKKTYDALSEVSPVLTMASSKGLEFPRVIILGVGNTKLDVERLPKYARLLYVAMTRAQEALLMTTSKPSEISQQLAMQASMTVAASEPSAD